MTKYEKMWNKWDAMRPKDRNKAIAKKMYTSVGLRSMHEVMIAAALSKLKREGCLKEWEYESETFTYQHLPQKYTPDFKVVRNSGDHFFIEAKGKLVAQVKKTLVSAVRDNPEMDLHIIFDNNNKVTSRYKTRKLDWAEKNNFPASVKEIKEEWL